MSEAEFIAIYLSASTEIKILIEDTLNNAETQLACRGTTPDISYIIP